MFSGSPDTPQSLAQRARWMLAECGCTIKGAAGASEVLCLTPALGRAGISFKKLLLKLQGVFNQGLGAVAQWFTAEVLRLRDWGGGW